MDHVADFLIKARDAARRAEHIFPEHAACEVALETGWGTSSSCRQANNLFGQKQSHPPLKGSQTLMLPTREFLHGAWVVVQAGFVHFADWDSAFRARMTILNKLSHAYPDYAAALNAKTGEEFVQAVSRRWSTDPDRAGKVLAIHDAHSSVFGAKTKAKTGKKS